jgi:excinuclease ABC subunit C
VRGDFRPAPGQIPTDPGVYRFRDADGRVIYVGKAKNLRARLTSYFQDPAGLHTRTRTMVATARGVDWVVVATEVEALQLEYSWIKEFDPRFNVRYRDDKSYPYLAVTVGEQYPRAMVMRGEKRPGVRYFGPYAHAWAIRETVDQLLRVFPMRTCSRGVFRRALASGRPCLLGYIDKCAAPCVGAVTDEEHRAIVEDFCAFMAGRTTPFVRSLEERMAAAAVELDYERAARLRDDLYALQRALERNAVVLPDGTDADVVGLASDELEAAVRVFHVRDGRVRGERGFVVERVDDADEGRLVAALLEQLYGEPDADVPRSVLVPVAIPASDLEVLSAWLGQRRGGPVRVTRPKRGDKRALHETVTRNAREELIRHRLRRAADHNSRSRALTELQDLLGLPEAPLRIECYDMAHLQGSDYVGSMVVLEDGLPAKREYRRFKVRGVAGNDDYAAMEEVLTRRLSAYLDERDKPITERGERPGKFAYPPQLLLVDGGKGQLGVADRVVRSLGLEHEIPVASLAKRFEEVYVPGSGEPIEVPRGSEALFMLQRIRDEAHRFANTFHRELRGKRMTASSLDGIPGLGETRKKRLVQAMGGVNAVKRASLDDLKALSWLPEAVAEAVHARFHPA